MENGLSAQTLNHSALVLAGLPDTFRMQLGPFNPQIQEVKGLSSLHSLNASAFRLRYANNYPAFPAHLIHHLPPQLFPTAVDPRSVAFSGGAFRPFQLSSSPKLFPSAFAPPHKPDQHTLEAGQDLSPGSFVPKIYDNDEDSCYRSPSDRDMEIQSSDLSCKTSESLRGSPKASSTREEKADNGKTYEPNSNAESDTSSISNPEDERACKRPKLQFDPTCCPICGQMVLLGEAENHFSKEVERLSQMGNLSRERKYLFEKVHPCFGSFGGSFDENGLSTDGALPRGRWETYQRIKSNRLSRLRIKHRRRRNGDSPLCPVCNDKLQGNVEDINLHVEHCLKKHSEAEEEEEENIDVEGDSETYGEYEWAGRHLVRATTSFLVGNLAAGLLSSATTTNPRNGEKDLGNAAADSEESSANTTNLHTDQELNVEDDSTRDRHTPSEFLGRSRRLDGRNSKAGYVIQSRTHIRQMIDEELEVLNSAAAALAWDSATKPDLPLSRKIERLNQVRALWKRMSCDKMRRISPGQFARERATNLLCRGALYTPNEARELSELLSKLREIYQNSVVCLKDGCKHMEPDLTRTMALSRDPALLLEAWQEWRRAVGPPSRRLYARLVQIMNKGARRNGYKDTGEVWREELEIKNLESKMEEIFQALRPLYQALHAVVRFRLRKFYGPEIVAEKAAIPAHLLGNMWGQSWSEIFDIVYGESRSRNITKELLHKKYTVEDMVHQAEDFYVSIGLRPMPKKFWKNSKWNNIGGTCHGTSVNMFRKDDFRMLLCAEVTEEDLHVIFHEMGHIEYFIHYQNQLNIFKDGSNSGMQEAIGEAVAMAASSFANIQRLGLIHHQPGNQDDDLQSLLHFGLNLLPQIPFALVVEKWRWSVFRAEIGPKNYNRGWWTLRKNYQGIQPPSARNEEHFDPAAKFHVSDNIPYTRYFIASIVQVQIFEAMCKGAVFGDAWSEKELPFPFHQCDIYGSKDSSTTLRNMMWLGSSIDFDTAVRMVTNSSFSVQPLLRYFFPLKKWLDQQIQIYNIPVGWN